MSYNSCNNAFKINRLVVLIIEALQDAAEDAEHYPRQVLLGATTLVTLINDASLHTKQSIVVVILAALASIEGDCSGIRLIDIGALMGELACRIEDAMQEGRVE
jgi:hypothetical protein